MACIWVVLIILYDTYLRSENEENFDFSFINDLDCVFINGEVEIKEKGIGDLI
jgi:hypothetical protein